MLWFDGWSHGDDGEEEEKQNYGMLRFREQRE